MINSYTKYSSHDLVLQDSINPFFSQEALTPSMILTTPVQFDQLAKLIRHNFEDTPVHDLIDRCRLIMGGNTSCDLRTANLILKDVKSLYKQNSPLISDFKIKIRTFSEQEFNKLLINSSENILRRKYDDINRCLIANDMDDKCITLSQFWTLVNDERKNENNDIFINNEVQYALREQFDSCHYIKPILADKLDITGSSSYSIMSIDPIFGTGCRSEDREGIKSLEPISKDTLAVKLVMGSYSDDNLVENFILRLPDRVHEKRYKIITAYLKSTGREDEIITYEKYMNNIKEVINLCKVQKEQIKQKRHNETYAEKVMRGTKNVSSRTKELLVSSFCNLIKLFKQAIIEIFSKIKSFTLFIWGIFTKPFKILFNKFSK